MNKTPLANAIVELRSKSLQDIERETAVRWAERAVAAYSLGYDEADEYAHEALEHAGLSGDDVLLDWVRQQVLTADAVSEEAVVELRSKSIISIQRETAYTWAWRAFAAVRLEQISQGGCPVRPFDAITYMNEAVEHATLAGDDVLLDVRRILQDANGPWSRT